MVQDSSFKNAVVDTLIDRCVELGEYPSGLATVICKHTAKSSPMRKLLVDFWVWGSKKKWFDGDGRDINDAPAEFWVAVAKAMRIAGPAAHEKKVVYPWVKDRCQYHEHPDGEPCCQKPSTP